MSDGSCGIVNNSLDGEVMVINGDVEYDEKRYVGHSKFSFTNTKWHLPLFGSPPLWLSNSS